MNRLDDNPAQSTTNHRGKVIVGPDFASQEENKGKTKPPRTRGATRQDADLKVDADLFGNEIMYRLVDELIVPAIVEQIVKDAVGRKESK